MFRRQNAPESCHLWSTLCQYFRPGNEHAIIGHTANGNAEHVNDEQAVVLAASRSQLTERLRLELHWFDLLSICRTTCRTSPQRIIQQQIEAVEALSLLVRAEFPVRSVRLSVGNNREF